MPHHCLPQVLPCPLEIRERCFFHIPQALCKKPKSSPYIEIFLDRRDHQIRIGWPKVGQRRSKARYLLSPFFRDDEILAGDPLDRLPAMQRAIDASHAAVRRKIRISTELSVWLEMLDRREQQIRSRQHFETEAASGKVSLDLVKQTLYPYQQEGMLHLAFTGRALLADEMGLGKTVQAIAACELQDQFPDQTLQLKLLDKNTFSTIRELIEAGVLNANHSTGRTLYRDSAEAKPKDDEALKRLNKAHNHLAQSEHKRRMAKVLKEGGFAAEALAPLREALETALQALAIWRGHDTETATDAEWIDSALVQTNLLPTESLSIIATLRENKIPSDESQTIELLLQGDNLLSHAASVLESAKSN